ncbi:hypothetical protein V5O48_016437 [Marasmius crinis-equi]|uniref:Uncharacterized protein n=1 Tax=Marasmius crinis-equi TaxID=585013 RepID=A0ABR3ERW1_9AGAR
MAADPIDLLLQGDYGAFGAWLDENGTTGQWTLTDIQQEIECELEGIEITRADIAYYRKTYRKAVKRCRRLKRSILLGRWKINRRRLQFRLSEAEAHRERQRGYLRSSCAQLPRGQQSLVELRQQYKALWETTANEML